MALQSHNFDCFVSILWLLRHGMQSTDRTVIVVKEHGLIDLGVLGVTALQVGRDLEHVAPGSSFYQRP